MYWSNNTVLNSSVLLLCLCTRYAHFVCDSCDCVLVLFSLFTVTWICAINGGGGPESNIWVCGMDGGGL